MRRWKPGARSSAIPSCFAPAFSHHPPYYHFDERATNYVDYGLQNSRGLPLRSKVWLALKQVGASATGE
jgi:hypothetical protein